MKQATVYIHNPDVVFRQEAMGAILFNIVTGAFLTVNETGAFLWKMCDGKQTEQDIVARSRRRYRVSLPVLRAEVGTFLTALSKERLLDRRRIDIFCRKA